MLALVVAATPSATRNALVEEHHNRITVGESPEVVAADAAGAPGRCST